VLALRAALALLVSAGTLASLRALPCLCLNSWNLPARRDSSRGAIRVNISVVDRL